MAEHKVRKHRQLERDADRGASSFCSALARQYVMRTPRPRSAAGANARTQPRPRRQTTRTSRPIAGGLRQAVGATATRGPSTVTTSSARWTRREGSARRAFKLAGRVRQVASARLARSIVGVLLARGLRHRRVDANPCAGVWRPRAPAARDRVLTNAEIAKLLEGRRWRQRCVRRQMTKLLLLTGCRLNEIAGLRWEEIGEDGGALHLPGARTKNHRAHNVTVGARWRAPSSRACRGSTAASSYSARRARSAGVGAGRRRRMELDAEMGIAHVGGCLAFDEELRSAGMGELEHQAPHVIRGYCASITSAALALASPEPTIDPG